MATTTHGTSARDEAGFSGHAYPTAVERGGQPAKKLYDACIHALTSSDEGSGADGLEAAEFVVQQDWPELIARLRAGERPAHIAATAYQD